MTGLDRYTSREMRSVWSDTRKFAHMLSLSREYMLVRGERIGVEEGDLRAIKDRLGVPVTAAQVAACEKYTQHDVVAFLSILNERLGPYACYLHFGLTSSDLVDTVMLRQMREAHRVLLGKVGRLEDLLAHHDGAAEFKCLGRTHGQIAGVTTWNRKMRLFANEVHRARAWLCGAEREMQIGRLAGPIGTHECVEAVDEQDTLARWDNVKPIEGTQVVPRDIFAHYVCAMVFLSGALERLALEVRLLSQSAVREVAEGTGAEQVGSSSMPHKRNPITSEKVCGLARQMRGYLSAVLEGTALWHERDISHSSVDRLSIAPACIVLDHMLDSMIKVIRDLVVYPTTMKQNIEAAGRDATSHRRMCDKQFHEGKTYLTAHKEVKEEI